MKRGPLIGIVAGAVVLVLLWYFVLFAPTSSDLSDTRDKVAQARSQRQQLADTVHGLEELSRNNAQQQASLRTLRAAVPPTPDLGGFILEANDIATAAGIDWLSIAPTAPAATGGAGPPSTIALSIQVNGGFFEVLDYLNRFERMERLVLVDTINVSAGGAGGTGASGTSGAAGTSGSTGTTSTDTTGAPDLSVTLTGRMFTSQEPAASGGSGTTPSTPGATTPTTPPASSSGTSS